MASAVSQDGKKGEKPQAASGTETDDELISDDEIRAVPETSKGGTNGTTASGKNNSDNNDFLKHEGDVQISLPSRPGADGVSNNGNGFDVVDLGRVPATAPSIPGTFFGSSEFPDINFYQQKKTLAKGMMDLALFSANANQLRYVLECADRHPYFYPSMLLISFSLICQVGVGMALLWNAMYNVKHEMQQANRANNFTVIAIFLVTVINVFVSAFGVANPPPIT